MHLLGHSWGPAIQRPTLQGATPVKEQKGYQIFDTHSLGHSLLQILLCVLLLMNGFFFGSVSSHNCVILSPPFGPAIC